MDVKVIRAKVQLMLNRPFYGSLVARLQLRPWDGDTFATDGEFLFVPEKHPYDKDTLESVVAHETWHCALLHPFRIGKREHMRWNIACDYAINDLLQRDGFKIHSTWLYDKKYAGMSAEKIYEKLPQGAQMPKELVDLIERLDKASKNNKGGKGKNKMPFKSNKELEQEWKENMASSIERNRGNLPAGFEEQLTDYMFPQIPWQTLLFRFLQVSKGMQDFRAYPFHRAHIWRGVFLPSLQGDFIEINVAWDTSGSMSNDELSKGLAETRGMCANFGGYLIHLYMCDADCHSVTDITDESEVPTVVTGRGGTSFVPVFKKIQELQLDDLPLVYFTDLDGEFPKEAKDNTLWVTSDRNKHTKVPFGQVIILN
jgi:predicted metal-dependent peptidase